jgi:hypothetical protein
MASPPSSPSISLCWKALTIILAEPDGSPIRKIVLRMGIFNMEMSFLGSIGHLMSGSGLAELLELMYAPNTVPHILSGTGIYCLDEYINKTARPAIII